MGCNDTQARPIAEALMLIVLAEGQDIWDRNVNQPMPELPLLKEC